MDINMSAISSLAHASNNNDVSLAVFKKAIDSEAQGTKALIAAIPQPPQTSSNNLPAHIGRFINVTA